ncbi:hypothetical protein D3C72_1122470 [compost metagenome]
MRDAFHGVHGLLHDLARLAGVVAGMADGAGRLCGVFRTGIDLCGQLIEGGSGFLQACGLLFRAVRKIAGGAGDLTRAVADADDGCVDRGNGFLEAGERRVEVLAQLRIFARELVLDAVGEIALRKRIEACTQHADNVLLHAAVLVALEFGSLALRLGVTTLGVGFSLHLADAGKLRAETFKRGGHGARLIPAFLSGNRHIVAAVTQRPDIGDQRGKRIANKITHGEIKRGDDRGENDNRADDHHVGLFLNRCVQGLMGNIHQHHPGRVEAGNGEGINETVIGRVRINAEIFNEALLA